MTVTDQVKINLGIAINSKLFLTSFSNLLNTVPGYHVSAAAKTAPELLRELSRLHQLPSVCIIDIRIPGSYKLVSDIRKNWPATKVIVLAGAYTDYLAVHAIQAGAGAILSSYCSLKDLSTAISRLQKKDIYYTKFVPKEVYQKVHAKELVIPVVTGRQLEMLQNCTTSANYSQIAVKMGITARGVDTLKETLFKKFAVKNRTDLIMIALRAGLVSVD